MADALTCAKLRLTQAHHHLTTLQREVSAFDDPADRELAGRYDPSASEYVFSIDLQPPAEWGLEVSAFVHHLRSMLENLLCALVEHRGNTPTRTTQFPILTCETDWKPRKEGGRAATRMIAGVSADDRDFIESVQPYKRRVFFPDSLPPDNFSDGFVHTHPLAVLRDLNNTDKHHYLLPSLITAASTQPIQEDGTILAFDPIQDVESVDALQFKYVSGVTGEQGTEIGRLPIIANGPNPVVEMTTKPDFVVSLVNGHPFFDVTALRDMHWYVENAVLPGFARAFEA